MCAPLSSSNNQGKTAESSPSQWWINLRFNSLFIASFLPMLMCRFSRTHRGKPTNRANLDTIQHRFRDLSRDGAQFQNIPSQAPRIQKSPMYLSIKNTTINKKYFHSEVGLQKILIAPKIDFVNRKQESLSSYQTLKFEIITLKQEPHEPKTFLNPRGPGYRFQKPRWLQGRNVLIKQTT